MSACPRPWLTLARSKGAQIAAVTVPLPYGKIELRPVRALTAWLAATDGIEGPLFWRIWMAPEAHDSVPAPHRHRTPHHPLDRPDHPGARCRSRVYAAQVRRPQPQALRAHPRDGARRAGSAGSSTL
jgi:hypothetical protein